MEHSDSSLRVRYAETDQMGVAYHANHLVWFEVGRTDFCRRRGFTYAEMESATQSFLVVAEAHCRYRRPMRYDQVFTVRTSIEELRKRTVRFAYRLLDESGGELARGWTLHVVTDSQGRPKAFPEEYRRLLAGQG